MRRVLPWVLSVPLWVTGLVVSAQPAPPALQVFQRPVSRVAAADVQADERAVTDQPCLPQATHLTGAKLWWEAAPDSSGPSPLIGYRVQRSVNGGRWQDLVDVPLEVREYQDDGLKPGNLYTWRLVARYQAQPTGELVSDPGLYAADQPPCVQVIPLAPPGLLRAAPQMP